MSREPGRSASVPARQFAVGVALVGAGIFVAVTRESASEWLVGTLVGLGLLAIGVSLPTGFLVGRGGGAPKDKED